MPDAKSQLYRDLAVQLGALLEGESDPVANAANMAALIWHGLPDLNWAGFYFRQGAELVLGPFQGKPACVRIPLGQGVCGAAAARGRSVVVPDVHEFPGHIACDPNSRSELVVPLVEDGAVLGVLDLDSPVPARFDEADRDGCEQLVALFVAHHRRSARADAARHRSRIGLPAAVAAARGSRRGGTARPTTASPPPMAEPCAGCTVRAASNCTAPNCRAARGRSTTTCATRPGSAGECANWRSSPPRANTTASSNGPRTSPPPSPRAFRPRSSTPSDARGDTAGLAEADAIVIDLAREIFAARRVSPQTYAARPASNSARASSSTSWR